MQINTKKDAKTLVSALRRELKALGKTPDQLSHSDCLTLLAKATGHASWNEWEAKLADDTEPVLEVKPVEAAPVAEAAPSRYPLKNTDGRFDFVQPGETGAPYTSWFEPLQGTFERVPGIAPVDGAVRSGGKLQLDYSGRTELDWDNQRTDRQDGVDVWADENANRILGTAVILLPEGSCEGRAAIFEDEDEGLPIREPLVAEFAEYFTANAIPSQLAECKTKNAAKKVLYDAQCVLGFWMTQRELDEALRRANR